MWSVGCIVFILLGGYMPFDDADGVKHMYDAIKAARYEFDPAFWAAVSADAKGFIGSLLLVDPAKRMSAAAALSHGWFTKHAPELASADLTRTCARPQPAQNAKNKCSGAARAVPRKPPRGSGIFVIPRLQGKNELIRRVWYEGGSARAGRARARELSSCRGGASRLTGMALSCQDSAIAPSPFDGSSLGAAAGAPAGARGRRRGLARLGFGTFGLFGRGLRPRRRPSPPRRRRRSSSSSSSAAEWDVFSSSAPSSSCAAALGGLPRRSRSARARAPSLRRGAAWHLSTRRDAGLDPRDIPVELLVPARASPRSGKEQGGGGRGGGGLRRRVAASCVRRAAPQIDVLRGLLREQGGDLLPALGVV